MNVLLCGRFDADEQAVWQRELAAACPGVHWFDLESARRAPDTIEVAVVANPPPGSLQGLGRLRLIQSLWAGVDRLLADPTLPEGVPIARMVDPAMSRAMAETALWAVLALHRGFFTYARQQVQGQWQPLPQRRADEVPVLVLGYGEMGRTAAQAIAGMAYPVTAWRREAASGMDGPVRVAGGAEALRALLGRAAIVVNLLPLTPGW
jgi:glyoxylate/hydroxypyruvate reductase A